MDPSNDSGISSTSLTQRYQSAVMRWRNTLNVSTNGTSTISTTIGATQPEASIASRTSNGLQRCTSEDLLQRLLRLQAADPPANAPPLHLYRTETGEHGEVYIATHEYRAWFRRTYPRAGELSDCPRPVPSSPAEGQGEKAKPRYKQSP